MITGYLMMASLCRKSAEIGESPYGTAKFVFRKYRSVLFPLLFSALIGFVVYEALIYEHPLDFTAERVPLLLFEVLPLQMAGFEGMWTTGVSWYLSAMLLGVAILHPLAKKDPLRFGSTWAPVITPSWVRSAFPQLRPFGRSQPLDLRACEHGIDPRHRGALRRICDLLSCQSLGFCGADPSRSAPLFRFGGAWLVYVVPNRHATEK